MQDKRALVVGVTGIAGSNLAEYLHQVGGWDIHGLSRRPPKGCAWLTSHTADLMDAEATSAALKGVAPSHVFYCTWMPGATEPESVAINCRMLGNLLQACAQGGRLRHVTLLTGTKHYLGPFTEFGKTIPETPFREDMPRLPTQVFYYDMEDLLFDAAQRAGFGWSVHRAHTIIGHAVGNMMNMGVTLACYASLCRATGADFVFPGHPVSYSGVTDVTDARLLARHLAWAATCDAARNEAFNVANGDVFRWSHMWRVIADYFGLVPGSYPGHSHSLDAKLRGMSDDWDRLVAAEGLQPNPLNRLASGWHSDFDLGRPMECFNSMAKSRRLGFDAWQDSEQSFIDLFDRLRRERIIP